jgi:hypothetical protein
MRILIEDAESADAEVKFGRDNIINRSIDLIRTYSHMVSSLQIAQQTMLLECKLSSIEGSKHSVAEMKEEIRVGNDNVE